MLELIVCFISGCIVGSIFAGIIMAAVQINRVPSTYGDRRDRSES
jgi:hypothetical protein